MPTIDQWFAVYEGQRAALASIATATAQIKAALEAQAGAGEAAADVAALAAKVEALRIQVATLAAVEQPDWPALLAGNTDALAAIGLAMPAALHEAAGEFGGATNFQTLELGERLKALETALRKLGPQAPAAGDKGTAALGDILRDAPLLLTGALGASVKGGAGAVAAVVTSGLAAIPQSLTAAIDVLMAGLAILPLVVDPKTLDELGKKIDDRFGTTIVKSVLGGAGALSIIEKPMEVLVAGALARLKDILVAPGHGGPAAAETIAVAAILNARQFGMAAHGLAAAAERFAPLKHLGLGAAAATLVDLAGFKPLADAATRSQIEGAITRPMRWASNIVHRPEIPSPGDLELFVRKRQLDLPAYGELLKYHGYTDQDIDAYSNTVYRDFTIRDLALTLDDVQVDQAWLAPRVRTIGYSDDDADQITGALLQRARRGPRGRVAAAAAAAAGDGLLPLAEYEGILRGLGFRDDVVALELQAAQLRERADYQRAAIATYRRQYVNDVIQRGDYAIALVALGIPPARLELELADADAARFPKVQAAEEAALKDVMTQVRVQLVPRYRALFQLGAISGEEYQRTLEQAGIAPGLAAQAVSLDAAKLRAQAIKTGNVDVERALDRLLADRQQLAIVQFRRGIINAGGLRAGLIAAGLPDARADVLVATEQAFAVPPPRKAIEPPAGVKDAIEQDFRRRTAIEDYRRGRIDEDTLYDELVAAGRTAEQADAEVGLEFAKRPEPKA
jgi:hypothetical protein